LEGGGTLKLEAIVFDYNGVLVDDLILHRDAYLRVAGDLGLPLDPKDIWNLISATPDEKRFLFGQIDDAEWADIRRRKDRYYFEMAASGDIVIPGAVVALESLSRSYPLALVSNTSRRYFEACFPRKGRECFRETLFCEDMDRPKPSADPLLKILDRLRIEKNRCCYIGDAVSDVQMAKEAGVRMIGILTGHHSETDLKQAGADRIVRNLSEFASLIRNGIPAQSG